MTFTLFDPFTNYCGPGYSDGKLQNSVTLKNSTTKPVNYLDSRCKRHDNRLAESKSQEEDSVIDDEFYNSLNYSNSGIRGVTYGFLVKNVNSVLRAIGQGNEHKPMTSPADSPYYFEPNSSGGKSMPIGMTVDVYGTVTKSGNLRGNNTKTNTTVPTIGVTDRTQELYDFPDGRTKQTNTYKPPLGSVEPPQEITQSKNFKIETLVPDKPDTKETTSGSNKEMPPDKMKFDQAANLIQKAFRKSKIKNKSQQSSSVFSKIRKYIKKKKRGKKNKIYASL